MRIDSYAHGNRWRKIHPGEKGVLVLFALIAALLSHHPGVPLFIALTMSILTLFGAAIPWQGYLRLLAAPLAFLLWSCLLLPVTFAASAQPLWQLPGTSLMLGFNAGELPMTGLVFSRSLGALCTLFFFALTTPISEIAGLLRTLGFPRLFVELMIIAYRQIFILMESFSEMRSAQEARLGYSSLRTSWRSAAGLAGNILIKTITRARNNHEALLSRGYDTELLFLCPKRKWTPRYVLGAGSLGVFFLFLALQVRP